MKRILPLIILTFFFGIRASTSESCQPKRNRSIAIDYENDVLLKDGEAFHYVSGSFHYFRAPKAYWRDRMKKMRQAGLNCLCTYIEWSLHAPNPEDFIFTGDADIECFIQTAAEEGLLVILRIGPYICAERDFGGFPYWLLTLYPNMQLRTYDPDYLYEVKRYYDVLLPKLVKHMYGNGGPVIMVQLENEYGSFSACNMDYKIWLRDLVKSYFQDNAIYFTTDGYDLRQLECGHIPEVYSTVDFGTVNMTRDRIELAFRNMRQYSPHGPLINSEFYPGWLSNWYDPYPNVTTEAIVSVMKEFFNMKANFNFYMFFGGTSFGFTSGANLPTTPGQYYLPQTTSYDYDAPMTEAGDPKPIKYAAIQDLIYQRAEYRHTLPPKVLSEPSLKGNYGKVEMKAVFSAFNTSNFQYANTFTSYEPKTFEQMKFFGAYVLYEVEVPMNFSDPAILHISNLRDRAIVYLDDKPVGILAREQGIYDLPMMAPSGKNMKLLVEEQGRVNFGNITHDEKGLIDPPQLSNQTLYNWKMTTLPMNDISWVYNVSTSSCEIKPPAFYVGEFVLPAKEKPRDTFVDPTNWGKGVIFVNNYNLGRYWPAIGSQVTLYVPGVYLYAYPQKNIVVMFETECVPKNEKTIRFVDEPYLDRAPPSIV